MSVEIIAQVFKRYPAGGGERLLALALADCANPDGTRVYPSVETLASMSMQSARSVQRQLADMLATGWLILVRKSSGRRGDATEYRISPEWIAGGVPVPPAQVPDRATAKRATGANLSPVKAVDNQPASGATGDKVSPVRVTPEVSTGDTAVSPNPSLPVIPIPIPPIPPVETGGCGKNPGPETQEPKPVTRQPWRWGDTRSGIERRGVALGVGPWDEAAFRVGQGEPFPTYRARVLVAHVRAELGVSCSLGEALRVVTRYPGDTNAALMRRLALDVAACS